MYNNIPNPPISNKVFALFVLAKDCEAMSPISIRVSCLDEWFRYHSAKQGIYVGAHLYPEGAQFISGRAIPSEVDH